MLVQALERSYAEEEPSTSTWVRENFVIGDVIGHGTFGKVYTVECRKKPGQLYAMKELMRFTHPKYIEMELKVLQELGGTSNVMQMHAAHRERDRIFLVMDNFPHDSLRDIIEKVTTDEILDYMKNLFIALQHLHKHGIIHRDIKPANFLYHRKTKRYSLIDFGLSQRYTEISPCKENVHASPGSLKRRSALKRFPAVNEEHHHFDKRWRGRCECFGKSAVCVTCQAKPAKTVNKAGTPGFRAPEILLRLDKQTPVIDVWSAGITMLSLLCRKHPLFRPQDDSEALAQIAFVLGTRPLKDLAEEEGHHLDMRPSYPGIDLVKLLKSCRAGVSVLMPVKACTICSKIIYDNKDGICLCASSQEESFSTLSNTDRLALEVVRRCLIVNPKSRYTSAMILSLLS